MENKEGINLLFVLLLGTFTLLMMGIALIFFVFVYQRRVITHQLEIKEKDEQMQREMLRATIQSQEEEQRRIARDLHDDLGPMLSAVRLKMAKIRKAVNGTSADLSDIDESKDMLDSTITQVRNISHRLLPPILEDAGLAYTLENNCRKMSGDKLHIVFKQSGEYDRIHEEKELALYRVVMELLNNIIKHSEATQALVNFTQEDNALEIVVSDNGMGFDTSGMDKKAGLGLKNIKSRLQAVDGRIDFKSSAAGTTAVIKVTDNSHG